MGEGCEPGGYVNLPTPIEIILIIEKMIESIIRNKSEILCLKLEATKL